jgi:hypothetical protein
MLTAHGLEAREEVFDHPCDDVPDVGNVIGGRRAFEEDMVPAVVRQGQGLLEDLVATPGL